MMLVYIMTDMEHGINYYKDKIVNNTLSWTCSSYYFDGMENTYHNPLDSYKDVIIDEKEITVVSGPYTFKLSHSFPLECVKYISGEYLKIIESIEKISLEGIRGKRCRVKVKPIIRLIYDGPDELALIWRLSIWEL